MNSVLCAGHPNPCQSRRPSSGHANRAGSDDGGWACDSKSSDFFAAYTDLMEQAQCDAHEANAAHQWDTRYARRDPYFSHAPEYPGGISQFMSPWPHRGPAQSQNPCLYERGPPLYGHPAHGYDRRYDSRYEF